ncbi:hypothetical protein SAMN04244581_04765 [Paracoccus denitrificans]|jgi:hypothetical protein|nr:hypothetical protein SAMN04244581_04765 [Paracoccus denitrificans]SFR21853.1 hypothetical protein SAMN04244569_04777 [Paracoccus denitrificans]
MSEPRSDFGCGRSVTPLLSLLVVRQAIVPPPGHAGYRQPAAA